MKSSLVPLFLTIAVAVQVTAQVRVIDIVPNSNSNEQQQDSEPNLAIDPFNPLRMAASAFTPDPMGSGFAPIYVSTDGGATWTLNAIVPDNNVQYGTGDITLRFGGSSGILYTGILRGNDYLHLEVLRDADFTLAAPMLSLYNRFNEDQPYVQATTVLGGAGTGNDRVYIGNNNLAGVQSATIDRSLDAATAPAPANFNPFVIETRATAGQDLPPIRPAIHPDGTVYGIFYRWVSGGVPNLTSDVVVVRADGWGGIATPFNALTDPGDGLAGRRVATGITVPFGITLGQNRLVASNVSIAVDPRNSDVVYIAWASRVGASDYTLHVSRSGDRGQNWSASDLLTITDATNPALAVNSFGVVGFLYQQLAGGTTWETHLRRSSNDGVSWNDLILARTPNATPASTSNVYLGDYDHLMAVGKDFYGIFSAANMPINANFPNGVQFLRNVDFGSGTLRDVTNTMTINPSIDPYFFQVSDTPPDQDYYVRDWTLSPTNADAGQEPSTYPWFYVDSDVWNQRSAAANAFNASDQPVNEDAGNDIGVLGDNFMFARVHRKAAGSAGIVNLHFLYANYGVGLNYQDADPAVDPTLSFGAADTVQSMTTGFPWHLAPTTSTHLCLGVEITGPSDPFVPPSLLGSSPGWPTTDLRVISDNNKAQRNIHVLPTGTAMAGSISGWAIAHNAATFPRDMVLRYTVEPTVLHRIGKATLQVAGGNMTTLGSEGTIRLPKMQPGENRWIRVTFDSVGAAEGQTLPVQFVEMLGETPINGFAISPKAMPLPAVIRYNLDLHRSVFNRAAAIQRSGAAVEEARAAAALLKKRVISEKEYVAFLNAHGKVLRETLAAAWKAAGWQPAKPGSLTNPAAHLSALNDLDAVLTSLQLADGDTADILQNVRWQYDLFRRVKENERVRLASQDFIKAYTVRKAHNDDYPKLLMSLLDSYRQTARQLQADGPLQQKIDDIERHLDSPRAAQKAHRAFLLALQDIVMK
jgi:hypothetical protein